MAGRNVIAIDVGRRGLRALLAERVQGRLHVKRALVTEIPDGLDRERPDTLGAWIRTQLAQADFPLARSAAWPSARVATVALAREHVGLKRIHLPTTAPDELPGMTRLAMQRELPFDADDAVIDYIPLEPADTHTTVIAVAVPESVLEDTRRLMSAARIGVERTSLRVMGLAALLRSSGLPVGSTMVIDVTGDCAEFCVLTGGDVRFSRAAEISGTDPGAIAAAVVTETRRTWMSYRIIDDAGGVGRIVLLGDRDVTSIAAAQIEPMLHAPAETMTEHPRVVTAGAEMDRLWPLAGLLLEPVLGSPTIDFSNPRRPPDVAAQTRKRGLFAAGIAAVVLLALWTAASFQLRGLDQRLETLQTARRRMEPDYVRYHRDRARLTHLEQWGSARIDWLEHAGYLAALTPPPDRVVLDSWTGTLRFRGVRFDRGERTWSAPKEISIVLDGEAQDRAIADAYRAALVDAALYEVTSAGSDVEGGKRLPFGFTYELSSGAAGPPAPDSTPETQDVP